MNKNLIKNINQIQEEKNFSGTVFVQVEESVICDISFGYANRAE